LTPTAGGRDGASELMSPNQFGDNAALLNAHAVVTETLVCVDDVEDLQRKNTYLVATVRSLTDELETRGSELSKAAKAGDGSGAGGAAGGAGGVDMAALVAEVAEMREARGRQEELVSAIVRQRDMYRIAAQAANVSGGGAGSPIPGAHGGGADSGNMGSPGTSLAAWNNNHCGMGSPGSPSQLTPNRQRAMMEGAQSTAAEQAAAAAAQVESALRQQVSELERNLARAGGERDMLRQVINLLGRVISMMSVLTQSNFQYFVQGRD